MVKCNQKKHLKKDSKISKEAKNMAVFSKPANFAFQIAESKTESFVKKDTRQGFINTIEKFKKHGGKTTSTK
ncbi:MAG: hypothetical protein U0M33_13640 [Lachnospiraceae bacterium]|nr:hypothetical protein [Lachnospiraceae bacterium]